MKHAYGKDCYKTRIELDRQALKGEELDKDERILESSHSLY